MLPPSFIPTTPASFDARALDAYSASTLTYASGPDDFSNTSYHAAFDESVYYEPCFVDESSYYEPSLEHGQELSSNYLAAAAFQPSITSISTYTDAYSGIYAETIYNTFHASESSYTTDYSSSYDHPAIEQGASPIKFPDPRPTSASISSAAMVCVSPALLDAPTDIASWDVPSSLTVVNSHRPIHSHAPSHTSARAASSPYTTPSLSPSPPSLPSLTPSPPPAASFVSSSSHPSVCQQPELIWCTRRNAHVAKSPSSQLATSSANPWKCPYCPYVQRSKRLPDLKRHVLTHTRPVDVALWVCCGVPLANAAELGVPGHMVNGESFVYEGISMVGGCRKTFSRRDALKRHLRREAGKCFSDALALYLPGNKMDGSVENC